MIVWINNAQKSVHFSEACAQRGATGHVQCFDLDDPAFRGRITVDTAEGVLWKKATPDRTDAEAWAYLCGSCMWDRKNKRLR